MLLSGPDFLFVMGREDAVMFMRKQFQRHLGLDSFGAIKDQDLERWIRKLARKAVSSVTAVEKEQMSSKVLPDICNAEWLDQFTASDTFVNPAPLKKKNQNTSRAFDLFCKERRSELKEVAQKIQKQVRHRGKTIHACIKIAGSRMWQKLSQANKDSYRRRLMDIKANPGMVSQVQQEDGTFAWMPTASSSPSAEGLVEEASGPSSSSQDLLVPRAVGMKSLANVGQACLNLCKEAFDSPASNRSSTIKDVMTELVHSTDSSEKSRSVGRALEAQIKHF